MAHNPQRVVTERRTIYIDMGPNETYQSALVQAKKQIDILPDNVIGITIILNKYVDTKER